LYFMVPPFIIYDIIIIHLETPSGYRRSDTCARVNKSNGDVMINNKEAAYLIEYLPGEAG
ncbi:MAG: hypothetical protein KAQ79_04170, partial [Cyclobacteriaceae bacterium]|nr:hypothetical protein [Cyclobacteriaceae bacterium]